MKKFLLLLFSFGLAISAWAQERVVTGKVTSSEDGAALPGVNVLVKGTTLGTVTDVNGGFSLNVPSNSTLVFSFIGYQSVSTEVGDRKVVDVALLPDVTQLTEVVVTAAGISKESRSLGYTVSTVKSDFLNQTNLTNPMAAFKRESCWFANQSN